MAAVVALGGCGLDKQTVPGLAGPSELGLSLAVSADDDQIVWDEKSQTTITVTAFDASGAPKRDVQIHVDAHGIGRVSHSSVRTGSDGRTSVEYFAPATPPVTTDADGVAVVSFTPLGTNYANSGANVKSVQIRLVRPFIAIPPDGAPVPKFFASPTTAKENEDVNFDASASTDNGAIIKYFWSFGDGSTGDGEVTSHRYGLAGTYHVTLTVTDDRGQSVTSAPVTITVGAAVQLTANFVFSPTDPGPHQVVFLNAEASTAPTGRTIIDYAWDFGDGHSFNGPKGVGDRVSHAWPTEQTYTVTLIVTDNTGRKATVSKTLAVKIPTQ